MNTYMSYDDVYKVIAQYDNENISRFADGWSRFPEGRNAIEIANSLRKQASFWENSKLPEIAAVCNSAADEIIKRMPK